MQYNLTAGLQHTIQRFHVVFGLYYCTAAAFPAYSWIQILKNESLFRRLCMRGAVYRLLPRKCLERVTPAIRQSSTSFRQSFHASITYNNRTGVSDSRR
jgi:hypothetical protein